MHLNPKGKDELARQMAKLINKFNYDKTKDKNVIILNWKEDENSLPSTQLSPGQTIDDIVSLQTKF